MNATLGAPHFDRIIAVEPGRYALAYLNVTGTLPLFGSHFPRFPMLPGVLLTESALALIRIAADDPWLRMSAAKRFRFRRFVVPGDQVELRVTSTVGAENSAIDWRVEARVAEELVATIDSVVVSR